MKRWLSRGVGALLSRARLWTMPVVGVEEAASPFFQDFRAVATRSHLREEFIRDLTIGKRVLHFGFLDSPFLEQKVTAGSLLHLKMKAVAREVYGVDVDATGLSLYRGLARDSDNLIWDVQTELAGSAKEELCNPDRRQFDLIVFAEVLEHLRNPGIALANLKTLCAAHGCVLCVTVPNALSLVGFANAVRGIESVHPDHYAYYSPYTLRKLLRDSGFADVELAFYSSPDTLTTPGLTKHGVIAMATASA